MKSRLVLPYSWIFILSLLLASSLWAQQVEIGAPGLSHVRAVRLSYVSGEVTIKRPGSDEWTKAIANTPIQEGFALSTSSQSFAEVQFENGSTARLGEASELDFSQLALDQEGNKLNQLAFAAGYGTFHFMPERGDVYTVKVAGVTLTPAGKSEFRTDLEQGRLRVEVFNGTVQFEAGTQTIKLAKDRVLNYDSNTSQASAVQRGIEVDDWDRWTQARDTQTELAMRDQAVRPQRSLAGWDDLNTYGEWANIPGYGYGWSPYEPMGWSPYSMGMWSMYPGWGMTWIGGEPWGWIPYHYGSWNYASGFGWFWMAGGSPYWSPALVSWYSGPGWIGWAPNGAGGGQQITAISGGALQNGQPVSPHGIVHIRPGQGTRLSAPPVVPGDRVMHAGTPLAGSMATPGRTADVRAAGPVGSPKPSAFRRTGSSPAPPTILMGSDPAAERQALSQHGSRWSHILGGSSPQPLRIQSGTTLGGHLPMTSTAGQPGPAISRGQGPMNQSVRVTRGSPPMSRSAGGNTAGGAMIAPHASSAGASRSGSGGFGGASQGGGHSVGSMGGGHGSMGGGGASAGGRSMGGGGHR